MLDARELVGPHDAEDLVQQAWLLVVRRGWRPKREDPQLVRAYLRTTMRRLVVDELRRRDRLQVLPLGLLE